MTGLPSWGEVWSKGWQPMNISYDTFFSVFDKLSIEILERNFWNCIWETEDFGWGIFQEWFQLYINQNNGDIWNKLVFTLYDSVSICKAGFRFGKVCLRFHY